MPVYSWQTFCFANTTLLSWTINIWSHMPITNYTIRLIVYLFSFTLVLWSALSKNAGLARWNPLSFKPGILVMFLLHHVTGMAVCMTFWWHTNWHQGENHSCWPTVPKYSLTHTFFLTLTLPWVRWGWDKFLPTALAHAKQSFQKERGKVCATTATPSDHDGMRISVEKLHMWCVGHLCC